MSEKAKEIGILLEKFISSSSSFDSFTFQGCYGMNKSNFIFAFEHFIDTGENFLDEYSELIWLNWNDGMEDYSEESILRIRSLLNNEGFWNVKGFLSDADIERIQIGIKKAERDEKFKKSYEYARKEASRYIANKKVREEVFAKHGKVCKHCSSENDLSIDHIIPVVRGGKNSIDNLQPLCRSCNSKKGGRE